MEPLRRRITEANRFHSSCHSIPTSSVRAPVSPLARPLAPLSVSLIAGGVRCSLSVHLRLPPCLHWAFPGLHTPLPALVMEGLPLHQQLLLFKSVSPALTRAPREGPFTPGPGGTLTRFLISLLCGFPVATAQKPPAPCRCRGLCGLPSLSPGCHLTPSGSLSLTPSEFGLRGPCHSAPPLLQGSLLCYSDPLGRSEPSRALLEWITFDVGPQQGQLALPT